MGWSVGDKPYDVKEHCNRLHTWENENKAYEVVDSTIVANSTYYAAVKITNKNTGKIEVCAAVTLLEFYRSKSGVEMGEKHISEEMGPDKAECPERILNILTPTDEKYAIDWRRRCREYHDTRRAAEKAVPGSIVRFEHPIKFQDGSTHSEFTLIKYGKRGRRFTVPGGHCTYRISNWRKMAFTIVSQQGSAA